MQVYFSPEQEAFKQEVTDFFEAEMPDDWYNRVWNEESDAEHLELGRAFDRKLIDRGYYVMHWPKEYGGQGRSVIEQAIFNEVSGRYGPPSVQDRGRTIVGPGLMATGTEEQKQRFLPDIAKGKISFTQGWTEPNAGSDLSMLETTARRDGDEYVINGTKMFTSLAHIATHMILTAITDTTVPKRQGTSVFIVEMSAPGISLSPLIGMDGRRVNMVYMDDVRVPATNLIGQEGKGFQQMAVTLNFERGNVGMPASYNVTWTCSETHLERGFHLP